MRLMTMRVMMILAMAVIMLPSEVRAMEDQRRPQAQKKNEVVCNLFPTETHPRLRNSQGDCKPGEPPRICLYNDNKNYRGHPCMSLEDFDAYSRSSHYRPDWGLQQ
jgi:hypothetical protein